MTPLAPAAGSTAPSAFLPAAPGVPPALPPRSCAHCGAPNSPQATFCDSCGAALWETYPTLPYASFWRRVAAFWIDMVVIWAAAYLLQLVITEQSWVGQRLGLLLLFVYYSALESSAAQATVGKRVVGIAVCSSDGRRLSFVRAALRTLAKVASAVICGVGFIMPLLTPRKQALHDILVDAVVIRR
jgi:uncharacterized RDD family membrane protein YckC